MNECYQQDETTEQWINEFSNENEWQNDWTPDAAHISSLDESVVH
jgi:hypothetical protein